MPKLAILVGAQNEVLGTFQQSPSQGTDGPAQIGFQAGPDQRVVEINVDDDTATLGPDALRAKIKSDYLK